ncbi:glycerol kinase GlpK [Geotoga petraea]|jgi:glycerol kinase|uniref:Glycerol kinase n=1 Tax=Geotoga petraea TaxID=28234 RepID=A0A1G6JWM3_9BACT|nr:glycerol kinase GlpK [Geotoga petraea]MDK2945675.1 glycerol kinase [Geotoga sp.]TGG88345.1 glycerol kinase [Geotoga petraea]SDC23117.1 glycerol kinase [Geotoga petraea]
MKKYIGAIDQGTTSSRFIIFDNEANIIAKDQLEHEQIYPKSGWVEHDPIEIWEKTQKVIIGGISKSGIFPNDLETVGITNQRETTIVWNRHTGKPYYNAIVWQDVRTKDICKKIEEKYGELINKKTGLKVNTYFSASKIKWILDNIKGVREDAEKGDAIFGTIDTWILWNLTGGVRNGKHITEPTNASRTLLMNIDTLEWDEELLKIFDIPQAMLPEIKSSSEVYGKCKGILENISIGGILGDQQSALFGQTCFEKGDAKNTYGTGCFLLTNTGENKILSGNGLLTTVAYKIGDNKVHYALEGSIAIAGALVQWLRDNLGIIENSSQIEELAEKVEDNSGVFFVPAFSGLFAPYWEDTARGTIVGMTRYTNKNHIARAALESTAFQTRDVIEVMEKETGVKIKELKVDGGMVVNNLLMQFQSDILNVPVIKPRVTETTALGAAYAAGLAVNVWSSTDELKKHWSIDKKFKSKMKEAKRKDLYKNWKKAIDKSIGWID